MFMYTYKQITSKQGMQFEHLWYFGFANYSRYLQVDALLRNSALSACEKGCISGSTNAWCHGMLL